MVRTATLALQVGILAFSGSALAQAEDGGPAVVIPDDWTTPPAVPDDWTTLLAVPTNQQLVPDSGTPPPIAPPAADTDLSAPLREVPPVLSTGPYDSPGINERPNESTSEIHFVLSFPLGIMNGFASHPGQAGTGFLDLSGGYSAYTSTIYGLGISLGVLYEADHFGIGADFAGFVGASGASLFIDVHGLLYLTPDSTAPFIGGGVGFLANTVLFICGSPSLRPDGAGPTADAELGLEFNRHGSSHIRVQLSLQALIPLYSDEDGSYPLGLLFTTRIAF